MPLAALAKLSTSKRPLVQPLPVLILQGTRLSAREPGEKQFLDLLAGGNRLEGSCFFSGETATKRL